MSLFNTLNNITTDKITINDEIVFKDNRITNLVLTGKPFTPSEYDIQKIPTVQFVKDFVDIQDNNYAKLNEPNEFVASNTFDENATFNKIITVAKNDELIVASLSIDGNSIAVTDSNNNTNTIQIQKTTISTTESTNKDTLTTDNIVTDSIKIPNNSNSYTITSITGSSESERSNNSLPTKDYVDDKIATDLTNCAKKNEANTFVNGYTQTFAGAVNISNTLTTTGRVNADNGIQTTAGTLYLGNQSTPSNKTKLESVTSDTPADTLTTDNLSLRKDLSVTGASTLTGNTIISGTLTVNNASTLAGNVTMGSKQSGQTTLTTTSGVDTFTTDKVVVGTVVMSNGSSGTYDITSIQGSDTTLADNSTLTTKGYVDDIIASLSNYAKLDDNNTFAANKTQTFSGPVITSDTLTANGGIQTTAGTLYLGNQSTTSSKTKLESVTSDTPADTLTTDNLTLRSNLSVSGTSTLTGDVTIGSKSSNPTTIATSSNTDTLTTDNITLRNNLTVNGETTLTSPVYFGSKSTGKSSLITDEDNYDKFTTDKIDVLQDLSVIGNTTLTGDLTTSGDVYLGQKEENKTTIITTQIPGSSPAEYEDTLTTDNVVIRDSLTINGQLDANLPQNYNYAYLYDTNCYTYNNVNYEYDITNHNFKVIGFRNNKNNTFIIEPYLLIEESNELKKYPVIDVDVSQDKFEYTVNNIDTYIYLPDTFDYIMCAKLLNKITASSASNIYISISFKYEMYINCQYVYEDQESQQHTIDTTLSFTNKTIYYIIRNPNFEIDINNNDVLQTPVNDDNLYTYCIGMIFPHESLYIINLANVGNSYLGYNSFNGTTCYDYQITSNTNILKNKIIEEHYNMYLKMQNNRNNYLKHEKYNKLVYIKQYNTYTNTDYNKIKIYANPNPDNDNEPETGGTEIINYCMNDLYKINWIKYNNNSKILTLYLGCISYVRCINDDIYRIIKLKYDYTGYTLNQLYQCYLLNNKIYLFFDGNSTSQNNIRLLFIFDLNDFTNKHLYEYNDLLGTDIDIDSPNKLTFNYEKDKDNYEIYLCEISNQQCSYYKIYLSDKDNIFYTSYSPVNGLGESDTNMRILDICYLKSYTIILSKNNNTNKYKLYYCSDIIKAYYQCYNINLEQLQDNNNEYHFNMCNNMNDKYYTSSDYECKLYITDILTNTKGVVFSSYDIETILMRI